MCIVHIMYMAFRGTKGVPSYSALTPGLLNKISA